MRIERDSFGEIEVPQARLWGAQTQRSLQHFANSVEQMPSAFIRALALVKWAAARANRELEQLDEKRCTAIIAAAEEVIAGRHDAEFPLSIWQTGSGTQTNMNMNEVLANRASEWMGGPRGSGRLVHPNDHVNLGQSSNDVFPTAMHVAVTLAVDLELVPACELLGGKLSDHAARFADQIKVGRTHLQDATPITLGQEFSGYAAQLSHAVTAIKAARGAVLSLAIGGTAVGTGVNTHPKFGERVAAILAERLAAPFCSAANKFAALAGHEPLVILHGALKTLACALTKIANDIRWMASGPRAGLREIFIPENEPGSSIMPGKVNPTQCESLLMICAQVMGNDVAVTVGAAAGNFELNVMKPLIVHNLMQSLRLLADGVKSFELYCVRGIEPDTVRMKGFVDNSLMLVAALAPHLGYDLAAKIAQQAMREGCSLKEAALKSEAVTEEQFNQWVRPEQML